MSLVWVLTGVIVVSVCLIVLVHTHQIAQMEQDVRRKEFDRQRHKRHLKRMKEGL